MVYGGIISPKASAVRTYHVGGDHIPEHRSVITYCREEASLLQDKHDVGGDHIPESVGGQDIPCRRGSYPRQPQKIAPTKKAPEGATGTTPQEVAEIDRWHQDILIPEYQTVYVGLWLKLSHCQQMTEQTASKLLDDKVIAQKNPRLNVIAVAEFQLKVTDAVPMKQIIDPLHTMFRAILEVTA